MVNIAPVVKQFIHQELAPDFCEADLGDDTSLLESGILDSFGIMTLLAFIENEFQIKIPIDKIEPANFETVAALSRFIEHAQDGTW